MMPYNKGVRSTYAEGRGGALGTSRCSLPGDRRPSTNNVDMKSCLEFYGGKRNRRPRRQRRVCHGGH